MEITHKPPTPLAVKLRKAGIYGDIQRPLGHRIVTHGPLRESGPTLPGSALGCLTPRRLLHRIAARMQPADQVLDLRAICWGKGLNQTLGLAIVPLPKCSPTLGHRRRTGNSSDAFIRKPVSLYRQEARSVHSWRASLLQRIGWGSMFITTNLTSRLNFVRQIRV